MKTDDLSPEVRRELDAIDAALAGDPVAPELTELGQLALALRDERPEADPFFQRKLDSSAAAGFSRSSRWSKLRGTLSATPMLVPGVAASVLLALIVSVALLGKGADTVGERSSSSSGSSGGASAPALTEDSGAGGGSAAAGSDSARDSSGAGGGSSSGESAERAKASPGSSEPDPASVVGSPPVPPPTGGGSPGSDRRSTRKVERSASMTLVALPGQLDTVADRIIQTADANGGFVVTSSVNTTEDGGGGEFLLRVPSARLDTVLAQLSRLAHVRARQQAAVDITAQHTSARDRLQDARAERRGLLRRLARAVTDAEVQSIKAQLRDVSARISQAKADLARVSNRASFSNVAVSLAADPSASALGPQSDDRWSPGDAARDAVRVLEVAAGVALIALAIGAPLGLIVLAGVLTARWATRRGRRRALDAL
jgi:hypothetical protein